FGHGLEHFGQGREEVLVRGELVRSQSLDVARRFARNIGREGVQGRPQTGRRCGGGGVGKGHGLMMSQPSHHGFSGVDRPPLPRGPCSCWCRLDSSPRSSNSSRFFSRSDLFPESSDSSSSEPCCSSPSEASSSSEDSSCESSF